jgi:hypothetical protein
MERSGRKIKPNQIGDWSGMPSYRITKTRVTIDPHDRCQWPATLCSLRPVAVNFVPPNGKYLKTPVSALWAIDEGQTSHCRPSPSSPAPFCSRDNPVSSSRPRSPYPQIGGEEARILRIHSRTMNSATSASGLRSESFLSILPTRPGYGNLDYRGCRAWLNTKRCIRIRYCIGDNVELG